METQNLTLCSWPYLLVDDPENFPFLFYNARTPNSGKQTRRPNYKANVKSTYASRRTLISHSLYVHVLNICFSTVVSSIYGEGWFLVFGLLAA